MAEAHGSCSCEMLTKYLIIFILKYGQKESTEASRQAEQMEQNNNTPTAKCKLLICAKLLYDWILGGFFVLHTKQNCLQDLES